jgi:hypothetical protein
MIVNYINYEHNIYVYVYIYIYLYVKINHKTFNLKFYIKKKKKKLF